MLRGQDSEKVLVGLTPPPHTWRWISSRSKGCCDGLKVDSMMQCASVFQDHNSTKGWVGKLHHNGVHGTGQAHEAGPAVMA
jgi:hypothetical protein